MSAYDRITFRGRDFDRITAAGVEHWEYVLAKQGHGRATLSIYQGPYSTAYAASGNTHAGSGAVDTACPPGVTWDELTWAGRLAGWFASHRTPTDEWNEHEHAVQLGNRRLSAAAQQQVDNWKSYDDAGLAGSAQDLSRDPHPFVDFHYPLGVVNLPTVTEEFRKSKGWSFHQGVAEIQRALNIKGGAGLKVDGIAGSLTRKRLARWEGNNGGDGDGIPGGLTWLLGTALFRVVE